MCEVVRHDEIVSSGASRTTVIVGRVLRMPVGKKDQFEYEHRTSCEKLSRLQGCAVEEDSQRVHCGN